MAVRKTPPTNMLHIIGAVDRFRAYPLENKQKAIDLFFPGKKYEDTTVREVIRIMWHVEGYLKEGDTYEWL